MKFVWKVAGECVMIEKTEDSSQMFSQGAQHRFCQIILLSGEKPWYRFERHLKRRNLT